MNQLKRDFQKAPITLSLIGICLLLYIISVLVYGVEMNAMEGLTFGAYNPVFVYSGHEYYRLITANFVHFGLFHIIINCYSLYGIGMFIEISLKQKNYFIVLLASMISTTLLPYLLFLINGFETLTVSGGVSGVIFGLIGALGALAIKYKTVFEDIFKQLAPNVILMIILSWLVPTISLSGHISGMIGGFLSTMILLNWPLKKKRLIN